MNDYAMGALEALIWARKMIERLKKKEALNQIRKAIEDLEEGIHIDFRQRLRHY